MKKIFSIILCAAVVLISGCSVVSQEEYNSVFEEKTSLISDNENLKDEISSLKSELDKLTSENEDLQHEIEDLKEKNSDYEYCTDFSIWMLGRPQSSVEKIETSALDENVNLETTYFYEEGTFSTKLVYTIKKTLSLARAGIYIASFEKAMGEGAADLMGESLDNIVIIYRHPGGSVIKITYLYRDDDNVIRRKGFYTLYGQKQGIAQECAKIMEQF